MRDVWTEGYAAGLKNDRRTLYPKDARKAREYLAGWLAARKDVAAARCAK